MQAQGQNQKPNAQNKMKSDALYRSLKELVRKLDVEYMEKNLKTAGVRVKSGHCLVEGKQVYVMDKNLPVSRKNKKLARFLGDMVSEDMYLVPQVREFIELHKDKAKGK